MYISGNFFNFENRLHQFANSGQDLLLFQIEGNSYTGVKWTYINKWNQEFRHIFLEISGFSTTGKYITNSGV